jgi:hypothetical protein
MRSTIAANIKQALFNRGFLIGVIGAVLVIFLSSADGIMQAFRSTTPQANGFHATLLFAALSTDGMTLALPIICTLPYTASFVDDIKSGFIKQYLPRSNVKSYIFGKLAACALSGGLTLFFGMILAYGISALVFTPMEVALGKDEIAQPYFAQFLIRALLFFFSGAFWSVLGMTFATLTKSKYIAYASPFIFYYVLIILNERYFDNLYVLYPKEWLNPSDFWVMSNFGVILLLFELTTITALGFALAARRRIRQI